MTGDLLDAYGDALSQALHAEAACVVPAPDGLDRIRARTTAALECLARDLEAARGVLAEIRDHAQAGA